MIGDAVGERTVDVSTQVLHLTNGKVSGSIDSETARPEGKRVANWTVEVAGDAMIFSGEVFDSEINDDYAFPFGRDGFNIMFDFRPTDRFANIGVDREVHQTLLNVYDKPFFSVALRPWSGDGMAYAGRAMGESPK